MYNCVSLTWTMFSLAPLVVDCLIIVDPLGMGWPLNFYCQRLQIESLCSGSAKAKEVDARHRPNVPSHGYLC